MNIAICDDNREYVNILEQYIFNIQNSDLSCDAFYSGEELVKTYSMGEGSYDVIFLDMEMDKLNGIETAKELRQEDKTVKIVFHKISSQKISSYREEILNSSLKALALFISLSSGVISPYLRISING